MTPFTTHLAKIRNRRAAAGQADATRANQDNPATSFFESLSEEQRERLAAYKGALTLHASRPTQSNQK